MMLSKLVSTEPSLNWVRYQTDYQAPSRTSIRFTVNLDASQGSIQDADFAEETSNLAKSQILQQAATAMLAQANASKQTVLALVR